MRRMNPRVRPNVPADQPRKRRMAVQSLEQRAVMAADVAMIGTVMHIDGSEHSDAAEVYQQGDQLIVNLLSLDADGNVVTSKTQSFAAADVSGILFNGKAGDDTFVNDSSVSTLAIGGDGDDTLIGGSAKDQLIGNAGGDVLYGREGNDVLLGGDGANILLDGNGIDTPPSTEDPVSEDPTGEDVADEEPAAEDPVSEDPTTEDPAAQDPTDEQPEAENPGGEADPLDDGGEPVVTDPENEETCNAGGDEIDSGEDAEPGSDPIAGDEQLPVEDGTGEEVVTNEPPSDELPANEVPSEDPVVDPTAEDETPVSDDGAVTQDEPVSEGEPAADPGSDAPIVTADGEDEIAGEETDAPTANNGEDVIPEAEDEPVVTATPGNDLLVGGNGHDLIFGGDGDDLVFGDDLPAAWAEQLNLSHNAWFQADGGQV